MQESFEHILIAGGKSNSLGRANEVIAIVLSDTTRLGELYDCLRHEDAWVRMRAVDSLEKICRIHPEWVEPYIDSLIRDFSSSTQPSILWHLAQIYAEVTLASGQKVTVVRWLKNLLSSPVIDWIVAANAMETLVAFTRDGTVGKSEAAALLRVQRLHKSDAIKKRAEKLLGQLAE